MILILCVHSLRSDFVSQESLTNTIQRCIDQLKLLGTMKNELAEEVSYEDDSFLLVMQTQHQQTLLRKYGNVVTLMDGVYRTTKYGFPYFFLVVKTSLGMGRVVGTIIPQQENENLLAEGIKVIKEWNPDWSPLYTMTDKSSVELGAIGQVHPNAIRLLCDFHRSQAWERWVNKNSNGVFPHDRETVLDYVKDLSYAKTGV